MAMLFAFHSLTLLALLSLALLSSSLRPRVALRVGSPNRQGLCINTVMSAAAISAEDLMKLGDDMHLTGDDKVRFVALMIATQKDQELAEKDHELELAGKDFQLAEKDHELELAGKDHELKLAGKDHELELAGKDLELAEIGHKIELDLAQSYRYSELSSISKRFVLEKFFRLLLDQISNDPELSSALDSSGLDKSKLKNLKGPASSARMTYVNEALLNSDFRAEAWRALGLPLDTPFPSLPGEIIYGDLSNELHNPALDSVYLAEEDASSNSSRFFLAAAAVVERDVVYFSRVKASFAKGKEREKPGRAK